MAADLLEGVRRIAQNTAPEYVFVARGERGSESFERLTEPRKKLALLGE